jgi:hypothetical protein
MTTGLVTYTPEWSRQFGGPPAVHRRSTAVHRRIIGDKSPGGHTVGKFLFLIPMMLIGNSETPVHLKVFGERCKHIGG